MVKVTIIVPVYNVENYLQRCVDSILNQSYTDTEIILVDDGSNDSSPEICDNYQNSYVNIRVIHKKNGGLSSARNIGIQQATGDYITFVDSDDWIAFDAIEYAISLIQKYNAEIAEYNISEVYNESDRIIEKEEQIQVYTGKEILQYYMMEEVTKTGQYSVCRCVFSKKVIEGLEFRNGKTSEDLDYKYKALMKTGTFVRSNLTKYFYFQMGNSISTGGLKLKDFDLYEAVHELRKLTDKEKYGQIAYLGKVKDARTAFSLLTRIACYGIKDKTIDKQSIIKDLMKEHRRNLGILLTSPIPLSRKCIALMLAGSYTTTEVVAHLFLNLKGA
jgi:glycosyltransferase involved in cell wall biosynthesis